jgi:aspartyl-tRNA(Asn)/glutamyl-tRNA(Gln) amidotransferase subunit B
MYHRRKKRIRIGQIRLEEDAGRLTRSVRGGIMEARMDYSSAGMPSLRLCTEPDFEIGEETAVFLSTLARRVRYLELGSPPAQIRCNAYAALAPYPENPEHYVKLRNLNAPNFVWKAVNAELSRQEGIILAGEKVQSESRLWNEAKSGAEFFQSREPGSENNRYRKIEELAPFVWTAEEQLELPESRRERLMAQFGLTLDMAELVSGERSRADFFEATAALGADPRAAAQWMASWLIKEVRRLGGRWKDLPLSPERFASVLSLLKERRIHGNMARQLITLVLEEDRDPGDLVKEQGWEQLADPRQVKDAVKIVITENPDEVRRIRKGDPKPIQYLTGLIIKKTGGLAEPALVKDILREELSVSLVYVLSMGGAISGRVGDAEKDDESVLRELLAPSWGDALPAICFESLQLGRHHSEEIVPSDWAALIEGISEKLNSGTAKGIVVTHGTDTLPYTAPLLYWLFAEAAAPLVLAASSTPPGASTEALRTLRKAVDLALGKSKGVYVVHGGRVLSPLNLKFERLGGGCYRNWNMAVPVFTGAPLLSGPLEADRYVLSQLLENTVNSICVIRVYPGLRSDYLISLMDRGVKNFFLELYDTGTAGFREGPYSLKRVFTLGKRRGITFYCSSQQEGIVSGEVWKEAVPLGAYTTETAVARFLAAGIIADSEKEQAQIMEADRDFADFEEGASIFDLDL